ILSDLTQSLGTTVRLGCTVASVAQEGDTVVACLSDGSDLRAHLVIGADGIFSALRRQIFPDAALPAYAGQVCWRVRTPRPATIDRRHFFLGGPVKVGVTPVSADEMYMFLLQHVPERPRIDDSDLADRLRALLTGFGGVLAEIRSALTPDSPI